MTCHPTKSGRTAATAVGLSVLLAVCACAGSRAQSRPAAPPPVAEQAPRPDQNAARNTAGPSPQSSAQEPGSTDRDDAELVVSRDVVSLCPKLRIVRQHVADFDPDMLWLAVLESLGECMTEGGPMAEVTLGVSGDEEHRHVVREVLGSRGVPPTRVVATPVSPEGVAECQGDARCVQRVEITITPAP